MSQPEQGLDMKLMRALTGHPQHAANAGKGLGRLPLQTIAGDDHRVLAMGQVLEQTYERLHDPVALHDLVHVWSRLRRLCSQHLLRV